MIKIDAGTTVAAIALAITVIFYFASRSREMRMKRTDLVRSYSKELYSDADMASMFMDIDHDRLNYDSTFLGSDRELALIKMLDYLNSVGHSWSKKVLPLAEIMPTTIAYAALRTWENRAVREYLKQIKVWDDERFATGYGFRYFEDLAIAISYITNPQPRPGIALVPLSAPSKPSRRVRTLSRFPALIYIWKHATFCRSHLRWVISGATLVRQRIRDLWTWMN